MQLAKTTVLIIMAFGVFLAQFWLIWRTPWPMLTSQFPYTALTSSALPVLIGVTAVWAAIFAKSKTERRLFYSILMASIVEVAVLKCAIWWNHNLLIAGAPMLNAFITFQFLRYGSNQLMEN